MRMCSKCGKGKWQGVKKDGKFVCVDCLAKEKLAEVAEKEEKEGEVEE
jgi:uncharacterized Zn finger protein (UPF0148 family)